MSKQSGTPHYSISTKQWLYCASCHAPLAPDTFAIRVMDRVYHSHCLDHLAQTSEHDAHDNHRYKEISN